MRAATGKKAYEDRHVQIRIRVEKDNEADILAALDADRGQRTRPEMLKEILLAWARSGLPDYRREK